MRIGSLCSGYGGLDMGVQQVLGGKVEWHCEKDKNASAILEHHWPGVPNLGDITRVDWHNVPHVDILTAGYPCQPFSVAGKRAGTDDARHIWPYIEQAIGVLRPRYVLLENVRGHLSLGFDTVLGALAGLRYDAVWAVVRASDTGAPHRRERLFVLATDASGARHDGAKDEGSDRGAARGGTGWLSEPERDCSSRTPSDTEGERFDGPREAWVRRHGSADHAVSTTDSGSPGLEARHLASGAQAGSGTERGGSDAAWGKYEPAIRRWEALTRPAPCPTEKGTIDNIRMAARLPEWMMGLPEGHVTGVPGLARTAQIKAIGNGAMPAQSALALKILLAMCSDHA